MSLIYSQSVPSIAHGPPRSSADYDFDFDFETSALIAQFALEDIEQTLTARKGKSRVDAPLTDEEFAYQLQLESFQQLLAVSEDAKLAKSIGDAVSADAAYLEAFIATEEAAAADRRAAEMLSRGERLPTPSAAQARIEEPDFIMHPEPPRYLHRSHSQCSLSYQPISSLVCTYQLKTKPRTMKYPILKALLGLSTDWSAQRNSKNSQRAKHLIGKARK